ncbi:MAG: hypothetical protein RL154_1367 [Pseudomonadota bacterium]
MFDKLSQGQRVVIASIVSIVFFVGYQLAFGKQAAIDTNNTTQKTISTPTQTLPKETQIADLKTPATTTGSSLSTTLIKLVSKDKYEVTLGQNGAIAQYVLLEPKFKTHEGKQLELFSVGAHEAPLAIRFADAKLNDEASKIPYTITSSSKSIEANGTVVTLQQSLSELNITKTVTFYQDGKYNIVINMDKEVPFFLSPGFRPVVHTEMMTLAGVLLAFNDDTTKTIEDGKAKVEEKFANVEAVAAEDHYYASTMYNFEKPFTVSITSDLDKNPTAFIAGFNGIRVGGYIGPKNTDLLISINPKLVNIIEYGYLTFMAKPMFDVLSWIEAKVGNWGWAIVIMTILVRLILFPLTLKGMISMNKIKELAPKMQELKEKYKGDAQKLNMHVLELYKKHNANPLSGCLPLILQIPIFFALYKVLLGSVELKGAPWVLWITDLSEKDPYFILPILMGATMFIQQRITPMNFTDPMQEKILKYLPVVFTVFFVSFPAGLTLYWFVSNVLSVAQQYTVNRVLAKHKQEQHHA